jgi:hypothetical protein
METQSQQPEAAQSLRVQILEIDLRVAKVEKEEYRRLLLSLASEGGATPATSVRPVSPSQRSQPRADVRGLTRTQTSSLETARDLSQPQPQPQPSSSSPVRRERSIRALRREVIVEVPSSLRPSYARIF